MGRKRIDPDDKLTAISSGVTPEEIIQAKEIADERGWSLSDVWRHLIRMGFQAEQQAQQAIARDLHKQKGKQR